MTGRNATKIKAGYDIFSRGEAEGKYDEPTFSEDKPRVKHIFRRRSRGEIWQTNVFVIVL